MCPSITPHTADLFKRLADIRVVPYYLHQLDLSLGTGHFRVSIEKRIALMRAPQGRTTGGALPRYMLDLPGGRGKIHLGDPYLRREPDESYVAISPNGRPISYREPLQA